MDKVNGNDLPDGVKIAEGPAIVGRIVIDLFADGSLTVNGPLDQVMFYGMIDLGKEAYRANIAKERREAGIQVARQMPKGGLLDKMLKTIKR